MIRPLINAELARPFFAEVRVILGGKERPSDNGKSAIRQTIDGFPPRPDHRFLSETIPLFFVGRNDRGLWLAREADGYVGGMFVFKRSALRFAGKNGAPCGCATMLLGRRFELDVENRGSPFAAGFDFLIRKLAPRMPKLVAWRGQRRFV